MKYMGIHLYRNIFFDVHVDKVVKRVSMLVFAVARIMNFMTRNILIITVSLSDQ